MEAFALLIGLGATAFICWVVIGLYRAVTSTNMATRITAKPAADSRSSIIQFHQIVGRK